MWTYFPWPSFFLKAWIRKRFRPETFGPTQEYRQSMFHRMSFVYALSAWTAVGCGIYLMMNEDKEKIDDKKEDALPHQEDINKEKHFSSEAEFIKFITCNFILLKRYRPEQS